MTLLLSGDDVAALTTDEIAFDAMRQAFAEEAAGRTVLPIRIDTSSEHGFFRVMPAVLGDVMGCKIMTLVEGMGTRYLVLVCDVRTGAVRALVDADELTKARTAATTVLAASYLVPEPPEVVGVLGTGFEAKGHLRALVRRWGLRGARVFSRSEANRARFVLEMSQELGIEVTPFETPEQVVAEVPVTLLATKSRVAVVDGDAFPPGAVLLSIGSTRLDLFELDRRAFERAACVVVDATAQVLEESGDVRAAVDDGILTERDLVPLAALVAGEATLPTPDAERDLLVFKSAGTALQDLALARELTRRAADSGLGRDIGEASRLKPFVGSTPPAVQSQ